MASSDTAADIMASEDKQMVLKGLAARSEYTRADMIKLTSDSSVVAKTKAVTNNPEWNSSLLSCRAYGFDEFACSSCLTSSRRI